MRKNNRLLFPISFLILAILACDVSLANPPAVNPDEVSTAAAQTVAALAGSLGGSAVEGTPVPPTAAAPPTAAVPTDTTVPSPTPVCDRAVFVSETIPDGTIFAPGATFPKTWRLRNTGACTWTTAYALVFDSGDTLNAPAAVPLAGNVLPGQEVDLTVNMKAPAAPGVYTSYWKLRNASGVLFGVGASSTAFFVKINVVAPTATSSVFVPLFPAIPLAPLLLPSTQQVYAQVTAPAGGIGHAVVACPSGSVVTGGGYAGSGTNLFVYNSSSQGNGWEVYARNTSGSSQLLNAYAICLSNTSGSSNYQLNQVTVAAGDIGHAIAACPSGSIITGGGFAGNDTNLFFYNSSSQGNGWEVYARNTSGTSQLMNAYAMCLSGTSGSTNGQVNQVTVAAGDTGHAVATCPSGNLITGGGFAGNDTYVYFKTQSATGNAWEAYGVNTSGSSRLINAYAICISFP